MSNRNFINYYDLLMISPRADRAMIDWAVRLMLARYEPKNDKTGDPAKYELVRQAYLTLVDPERRAAHDEEIRHREQGANAAGAKAVIPAAASSHATSGALTLPALQRQRERRDAVLRFLYERMVANPIDPEAGRTELMKQLGVSSSELEFTLWYLREKQWMIPSQKGSYRITVAGLEYLERKALAEVAGEDGESEAEQPQPTVYRNRSAPEAHHGSAEAAAGKPRAVEGPIVIPARH